MSPRVTKIARLRAAIAKGDWRAALAIAARFAELGEHEDAIRRAHEAFAHPDFYRQLGKDPAEMFEAGKRALCERYGAP